MEPEKFNKLKIGDYVVLKEIHERNLEKYFSTMNTLLDGEDVPWPTFEQEAFRVDGRRTGDRLESPYIEPISLAITPQMVDGCETLRSYAIDRRPSVFFKENKGEILNLFKKLDGISNAHGDIYSLVSYLDDRGWLNNAQSAWSTWKTGLGSMGFYITTKYMEFGLEVVPPNQTSYACPRVEFAFDPKGTWDKWNRCSFQGTLPFHSRRRGTVIQDVFDVMDKLHTKKGFKALYDYSAKWNQTHFV